jgi:hypothetical protein
VSLQLASKRIRRLVTGSAIALAGTAGAVAAGHWMPVPSEGSARSTLIPLALTDDRIAFVGEDPDTEEPGRFTGRFSVHWEDEATGEWDQGPEGVSAEDAIAWGRSRARTVLVSLDGGSAVYSAGERQPQGESYPAWPEGLVVHPRPTGSVPDGSEEEVYWLVQSEARPPRADEQLAVRLAQEIRTTRGLAAVNVVTVSGRIRVTCQSKAPGLAAATENVHTAVTTLLRRLFPTAYHERLPEVRTVATRRADSGFSSVVKDD